MITIDSIPRGSAREKEKKKKRETDIGFDVFGCEVNPVEGNAPLISLDAGDRNLHPPPQVLPLSPPSGGV